MDIVYEMRDSLFAYCLIGLGVRACNHTRARVHVLCDTNQQQSADDTVTAASIIAHFIALDTLRL